MNTTEALQQRGQQSQGLRKGWPDWRRWLWGELLFNSYYEKIWGFSVNKKVIFFPHLVSVAFPDWSPCTNRPIPSTRPDPGAGHLYILYPKHHEKTQRNTDEYRKRRRRKKKTQDPIRSLLWGNLDWNRSHVETWARTRCPRPRSRDNIQSLCRNFELKKRKMKLKDSKTAWLYGPISHGGGIPIFTGCLPQYRSSSSWKNQQSVFPLPVILCFCIQLYCFIRLHSNLIKHFFEKTCHCVFVFRCKQICYT